jgi:hypothetical protein
VSRCFLTRDQVIRGNICQSRYLQTMSFWNITQYVQYQLTCDSNKLQSIQTPLPVFSREIMAAMMAPWVYKPVAMSVAATPTLAGGRSGSPVLRILIR